MFFPEELITYAVYSNPADFCQGKKTPERWLQLIFFGRGGCLMRSGSRAFPAPALTLARSPGFLFWGRQMEV